MHRPRPRAAPSRAAALDRELEVRRPSRREYSRERAEDGDATAAEAQGGPCYCCCVSDSSMTVATGLQAQAFCVSDLVGLRDRVEPASYGRGLGR